MGPPGTGSIASITNESVTLTKSKDGGAKPRIKFN